MLYAVIFRDHPAASHVRAARMCEHLAWLRLHSDTIKVAGSLREAAEQPPRGALWIAEVESKEQLESLIRQDPFFEAGLRETWETFLWTLGLDRAGLGDTLPSSAQVGPCCAS